MLSYSSRVAVTTAKKSESTEKHRMKTEVLLVDTDATVASQLGAELTRRGAMMHHASTGIRAQPFIDSRKLHGMFVALDLSGTDGEALIRRVRRSKSNAGIPVVVLTTEPALRALEGAMRAGATHFLVKPLGNLQLPRLMDRILGWMRRERRIYQRASVDFQVLCSYGPYRHLASGINLSATGMLVSVTSPLSLSDEVQLTFPLDPHTHDPFVLTGQVARVEEEGERVGLTFTEMRGDQASRLQEWVEQSIRRNHTPGQGDRVNPK